METTSYYSNQAAYAFGATFFLFVLVISILYLICMWKIYAKAGQPGWAGIIPIYNIYILTKIVGKPGWWIVFFLIPFVNVVIAIWLINLLSKSFGKDEGFTVGLLFLGIIFYPILAFSKKIVYIGPAGDPTHFHKVNDELNAIGKNL
ncbi:DUF5684 domain-containing protein [Chitinophaga sp. 30R24]|uniref:DUF5684 domain-containing protein n=1 Tax=Chitinophaga sp. 30R24 TaxID=3248838 RepID=UPI003B8F2E53